MVVEVIVGVLEPGIRRQDFAQTLAPHAPYAIIKRGLDEDSPHQCLAH